MAEPLVISALTDKRARILGEIEKAKDHLADLQDQLAHIDGTMRLFGCPPNADQKPIRTRPRTFNRGELTRLLFDLLRQHGPQTTAQLRDAVMDRKSMPSEAQFDIHRRVFKAMHRQEVRGAVRREEADGGVVWRLAS